MHGNSILLLSQQKYSDDFSSHLQQECACVFACVCVSVCVLCPVCSCVCYVSTVNNINNLSLAAAHYYHHHDHHVADSFAILVRPKADYETTERHLDNATRCVECFESIRTTFDINVKPFAPSFPPLVLHSTLSLLLSLSRLLI